MLCYLYWTLDKSTIIMSLPLEEVVTRDKANLYDPVYCILYIVRLYCRSIINHQNLLPTFNFSLSDHSTTTSTNLSKKWKTWSLFLP